VATNQDQNSRDVQQARGVSQQQNPRILPTEGYQAYPGTNLLEERDRQRQQFGRELQELDREIEVSEGYRFYNRMSLLEKSYFVFDVNYLNLKHILNEFEQPMVFLKLWEEKNRNRFDLFINDVIRLLHNYLAGARTLLDHIRMLQDDMFREIDFSDEYRTRWNQQFGGSALPQFVEDLLIYMLHKGVPFALAELSFDRLGSGVEVDSAIRLDTSKLGEWDGWSEKGREYLDTLDYKVRLDDIVKEHAANLAAFHQWFVTRQSELHQEAAKELEELKSKRQHLQQNLRRLEDTIETVEKTAVSIREEREKLAKELEAERQYRAWDKERADRLEAHLENERNKGFWSRVFRPRKRA
jgi:DNA polymerase III alpha subunit (gram-positive type)